MRPGFLLAMAALAAACVCPAEELKPNTEFKVKLLGPLSTETNQKGDKITAQVVAPAQYAGAIMEGEVKESKSGNKFKGKSTLLFTFQTLVPKAGSPMPVDRKSVV